MISTNFRNLKISNAEAFRRSISDATYGDSLYLTYGKIDPWVDELEPNVTLATVSSTYEVWKEMVGGKRIIGSDIQHIIPKNTWEANTSYFAYDDASEYLEDSNTKFYVLTSANAVYKCISNNKGNVSTVEPSYTGTQMGSVETDGYVWKYMYSLSEAEKLNFVTKKYIPVKTLTGDDGSDQWDIQEAAIEGGIHSIVITNPGSGYTNTATVTISLTGDGSSFEGTVVLNVTSQTVSSITITDPGMGYTFANVTISGGGGSNATGRAIISPPGGHGSNPLYELGGSRLLINGKFIDDEDGVLPTTNDFRQLALIKNPYLNNTTTVSTNTAFFQGLTLTMVGAGDYVQDEWVYQGGSVATAEFRAKVVEWNSSTSTLKVVYSEGNPINAALIGDTSTTARVIGAIIDHDLEPNSGHVLYIDNIEPVSRASDQTENFKIVLNF